MSSNERNLLSEELASESSNNNTTTTTNPNNGNVIIIEDNRLNEETRDMKDPEATNKDQVIRLSGLRLALIMIGYLFYHVSSSIVIYYSIIILHAYIHTYIYIKNFFL